MPLTALLPARGAPDRRRPRAEPAREGLTRRGRGSSLVACASDRRQRRRGGRRAALGAPRTARTARCRASPRSRVSAGSAAPQRVAACRRCPSSSLASARSVRSRPASSERPTPISVSRLIASIVPSPIRLPKPCAVAELRALGERRHARAGRRRGAPRACGGSSSRSSGSSSAGCGHVGVTCTRAVGPSVRLVTDLAQRVILTALPCGPSDRRWSRWYASGVAGWVAGRLESVAKPGSG